MKERLTVGRKYVYLPELSDVVGSGQPQGNPEPGGVRSSARSAGQVRLSPPRDTRPVEPGVKDGGQSDGRMGWAKKTH